MGSTEISIRGSFVELKSAGMHITKKIRQQNRCLSIGHHMHLSIFFFFLVILNQLQEIHRLVLELVSSTYSERPMSLHMVLKKTFRLEVIHLTVYNSCNHLMASFPNIQLKISI